MRRMGQPRCHVQAIPRCIMSMTALLHVVDLPRNLVSYASDAARVRSLSLPHNKHGDVHNNSKTHVSNVSIAETPRQAG